MFLVTYVTHKLSRTSQSILGIFSKSDKVKHKTLTLHETLSIDITKHQSFPDYHVANQRNLKGKTIARKMKFVRCHIRHKSLQVINQEWFY